MTLRPTTDIQFKEYEWSYREGLDFISDAVENNLNRVYGAFKVLDSENDFATGDKKLETAVGNYIPSLIPGFISYSPQSANGRERHREPACHACVLGWPCHLL